MEPYVNMISLNVYQNYRNVLQKHVSEKKSSFLLLFLGFQGYSRHKYFHLKARVVRKHNIIIASTMVIESWNATNYGQRHMSKLTFLNDTVDISCINFKLYCSNMKLISSLLISLWEQSLKEIWITTFAVRPGFIFLLYIFRKINLNTFISNKWRWPFKHDICCFLCELIIKSDGMI